jgi:CelD/BcsL family acetyltransferase involved in cellulose biosynthesis
MKISLVAMSELGPVESRRWDELQACNPSLASPCFSRHFAVAAARAIPSVRVAVLEDGGRTVGFFPFQQRWGAGQPAGGRLSDHHGVIAAPDTRWDWMELLKCCRLSYWQFGDLPASQRPPVNVTAATSPGLDLSRGYEAYWNAKVTNGNTLHKLPRLLRKLERDVGPIRFELDSRDPALFDEVIRLKREQCQRTAQLDFFAWGWTRSLVAHIRDMHEPA